MSYPGLPGVRFNAPYGQRQVEGDVVAYEGSATYLVRRSAKYTDPFYLVGARDEQAAVQLFADTRHARLDVIDQNIIHALGGDLDEDDRFIFSEQGWVDTASWSVRLIQAGQVRISAPFIDGEQLYPDFYDDLCFQGAYTEIWGPVLDLPPYGYKWVELRYAVSGFEPGCVAVHSGSGLSYPTMVRPLGILIDSDQRHAVPQLDEDVSLLSQSKNPFHFVCLSLILKPSRPQLTVNIHPIKKLNRMNDSGVAAWFFGDCPDPASVVAIDRAGYLKPSLLSMVTDGDGKLIKLPPDMQNKNGVEQAATENAANKSIEARKPPERDKRDDKPLSLPKRRNARIVN